MSGFRRQSVYGLLVCCLVVALSACERNVPVRVPVPAAPAAPRLGVYVGTYTGSGSRGVYRFELDTNTGATTDPVLAGDADNPSFLALHPNGRVLYAVNEIGNFRGTTTGAVSAFAIDAATGRLGLLGQQASGGADPCFIAVNRSGRDVLVANYTGGSVAVLPLDAEGLLLPATAARGHLGSGPVKERQAEAHAHAIVLDPAERFALAADLGADRIFIDRFDAAAGTLAPNDPEAAVLEPGSGPRHLAWHPTGAYLYAINELASTVTAFRYDPQRGALAPLQSISTLPAGYQGRNTAAEIAVSRDGRFLYASNRGDDSLALYTVDATTGRLAALGHVATGGRTPRHFAIDPSGRWLLAANQESDSIVIFRLDPATGRPVPSGRPIAIAKPACILFAAPSR